MSKKKDGFVFGKENYTILFIGLGLVVLGLILMSGGGSEDPKEFNPDIFSARRITIAPLSMLAGFITIVFAIMRKPKDE